MDRKFHNISHDNQFSYCYYDILVFGFHQQSCFKTCQIFFTTICIFNLNTGSHSLLLIRKYYNHKYQSRMEFLDTLFQGLL